MISIWRRRTTRRFRTSDVSSLSRTTVSSDFWPSSDGARLLIFRRGWNIGWGTLRGKAFRFGIFCAARRVDLVLLLAMFRNDNSVARRIGVQGEGAPDRCREQRRRDWFRSRLLARFAEAGGK